jgi:glycosyltransferase involved in cell wall biosynthesis
VRVGVFTGLRGPEEGGGYVFGREIQQALRALAAEAKHEFVTIEGAPSVWGRAKEALWRHSSVARGHLSGPGWLQAEAERLRVDFLWFLTPACHFLELPYAAIVWDLQHRTMPWFPELTASGEWERRERLNALFLPRASLVVTGTQAGADDVVRSYGVAPERILLLPHPTPSYALNAPPAGAPKAGTNPLLFYPAQFWPHKNQAALIEALALLKTKHGIIADLALTGSDKGNRGYCEQLADKLGVRGAVRFLGFVSTDELVRLYQQAAALAYVSFGGPENLPPLEAFALGCPVVAADIPGASEQLGDAALLVDPGSPPAIADALAKVITDRRFADELRGRGRERAKSRSAEAFVRGMFAWLDRFERVRRAWPLSSEAP